MTPMRFNNPQEMLDSLGQQDFVRNNPTTQGYFNTLQEAYRTGDTSKAEETARNICNSYGLNPMQMFQMVMGKLVRRN